MTTTATLSTKELVRVSNASYTNKVITAGLAYDIADTLTVEDTVTAYEALELPVSNGYKRVTALIGAAVADDVTVEVSYPALDFEFTANNANLQYNKIFLFLGTLANVATVTNSVRVNNEVTFTTSAAHGLIATDEIYIGNTTGDAFDGFYTVLSAPTATTFTAVSSGPDVPSASDVGNVYSITHQSYLYGVLVENPAIILASGQTQTYRVIFSLDN